MVSASFMFTLLYSLSPSLSLFLSLLMLRPWSPIILCWVSLPSSLSLESSSSISLSSVRKRERVGSFPTTLELWPRKWLWERRRKRKLRKQQKNPKMALAWGAGKVEEMTLESIVRNCPSPMLELEPELRLGHSQKGNLTHRLNWVVEKRQRKTNDYFLQ